MASNNYYLSPEVFVMIFKNLSFRDVVENCAKVCVKWESIVAQHFMQPYIIKLTNYDQKICHSLKILDWSDKCSNPEKIVSFFNMENVKNYPGNVPIHLEWYYFIRNYNFLTIYRKGIGYVWFGTR